MYIEILEMYLKIIKKKLYHDTYWYWIIVFGYILCKHNQANELN